MLSGGPQGDTQSVLCRAKVNLTLHVGAALTEGRWSGYHPVESLVVFADMGDRMTFAPGGDVHRLAIDGPHGGGLSAGADNLVIRALIACDAPPTHATLTKVLPVSSGLGGGSTNAAAVLRRFPSADVDAAVLGADIPVCRLSKTAMMEGIGEHVTTVPGLGQIAAVLVNPGAAISTAAVFSEFDATPRAVEPAQTSRNGSLLARAQSGRNDLQPLAIAQAPVIRDVLDAITAQPGCRLSRMSGSGATCFGVFDTPDQAEAAAKALAARGWWSVATQLGDA